MIQRIGVKSVNYCLISFKKGKAFQHVRFDANSLFKDDKDLLIKKLDALNPPVNCCPALHDDFDQAAKAFKTQAIRITSKKVNVRDVDSHSCEATCTVAKKNSGASMECESVIGFKRH